MKFGLNPAFDWLSGKLGKSLVALKVKDVLKVGGVSTTGVIRTMGAHASYGQILKNVREAWRLSAAVWTNDLSLAEKTTWNEQAKELVNQGYVVKSGYQLFLAECLALYGSQYGSGVFPTGLDHGGSSWQYVDRANFNWTA